MKFIPSRSKAKLKHAICLIIVVTGLLFLISTSSTLKQKLFNERPANHALFEARLPNRALYHRIIFRDIKTLNSSSPTVHPESKLIVIVNTRPDDNSLRNAVRQTWANPLSSKAVRDKTACVIFVIGAGYPSDSVQDEMRKHNDILQVNVPDSYTNLVYKVVAASRWIAANYPDKFVLKVDLDTVLILDKVIPLLKNPTKKFMLCYVIEDVQPVRDVQSPWYIPESSYSGKYLPPYCNGPTYLISPAALSALMQATRKAEVFEVEDAFFTGTLAALANVEIRKQSGIWSRVKSSQICVNGKGTVISYPVHYATSRDIHESWDNIRTIRCRNSVEDILALFMGD